VTGLDPERHVQVDNVVGRVAPASTVWRMNVPDELRYSKEHEWARRLDGGRVRVGITDFAQDALGDVVYVDLPATGSTVGAADAVGELESTKSVSEMYAPLSGVVVAVNEALADNPQLINDDPYGEGWLIEIEVSDADEFEALLDADAYRSLTEG
jgi:glycine cleavage system H protein